MEEKTSTKPDEAPQPDPALMRQQQLTQQYQQINGRIMELRQQETLLKDMIMDATMQAAEIRGALKEITQQKG
jgi:TolA-binding protein